MSTTLRLGERVLVRCDDGLLVTEYVLFDATDIVLRATDPVTVRETGYITTAKEALERLARAGATPELADEAAHAIPGEVVTTFGRSGALGSLGAHLGPCELFDGAVYRASSQAYEGAWLDLRSLAEALGRGRVSGALQALHLAAALHEVGPNTPLHLSTANATRDRRPGERTHRRVALEGVKDLPDALRRLAPNPRSTHSDAQRDRLIRDALLARVRERVSADAAPALREHLARLEGALSASEARSVGPLSDPALWAIEQQLASGDAHGVAQKLEELERAQGSSAALRYLRARAALVGGDAPPSSVAQTLSVIANEDRSFHEAELGAARAWLAAGEDAYARHFARRIAEDGTARDSERFVALEILDATAPGTQSLPPPPVAAKTETNGESHPKKAPKSPSMNADVAQDPTAEAKHESEANAAAEAVEPAPATVVMPPVAAREPAAARASNPAPAPVPEPAAARAPDPAPVRALDPAPVPARAPDPAPAPARAAAPEPAPSPANLHAPAHPAPSPPLALPVTPEPEPPPAWVPLPPVAPLPRVSVEPVAARGVQHAPAPRTGLPGASLPPVVTVPPPSDGSVGSVGPRHDPELVESLPLPMGATEDVLAIGDWPTTPIQARTAMTRLARSLARDYRLWYGSTLRCNVLAVDAMQRHLSQRYAGATLDDSKIVLELQRHGALLSEILARRLGAEWVDIGPTEPGYWAMYVAPRTRCWPIGRVYRFVSLGHRERDLVSYYLEVETRSRS